jgi:hypothetical protein
MNGLKDRWMKRERKMDRQMHGCMNQWTDKVNSFFYHEVKFVLAVEELVDEKHFSRLFSSMLLSHFDDAAKKCSFGFIILRRRTKISIKWK